MYMYILELTVNIYNNELIYDFPLSSGILHIFFFEKNKLLRIAGWSHDKSNLQRPGTQPCI